MNRWSIETRNRVLALAVVTAVVLALIWFFVVGTLEDSLRVRREKIEVVQSQLNVKRAGIQRAEKYNDLIRRGGLVLSVYENQMAQGDLNRWEINWLNKLQKRHNITITRFGSHQPAQLTVPPRVPYKAATYSVEGNGRYHDFGAFLADLENYSPFIRLNSLSLDNTSSGVANTDNLRFQLEFVTLIKSTVPLP